MKKMFLIIFITTTCFNLNAQVDINFIDKVDTSLNGQVKYYSAKGDLKCAKNYKNGKLDGIVTYYYPNGIKKKEGVFHNDIKDGEFIYWNEAGEIILEMTISNDSIYSNIMFWDEARKKKEISVEELTKLKMN